MKQQDVTCTVVRGYFLRKREDMLENVRAVLSEMASAGPGEWHVLLRRFRDDLVLVGVVEVGDFFNYVQPEVLSRVNVTRVQESKEYGNLASEVAARLELRAYRDNPLTDEEKAILGVENMDGITVV